MSRLFAGTPFDIPPTCDRCEKRIENCRCAPLQPTIERQSPSSQIAKVRADQRKHKRIITVVWGLEEPATDLPDLLSKLKSACGAGGAIKEGQLELQGDHVARVKATLCELGYRVR
ncbi:MAG: translation initiation factor [Pirellulaceae bacterium]